MNTPHQHERRIGLWAAATACWVMLLTALFLVARPPERPAALAAREPEHVEPPIEDVAYWRGLSYYQAGCSQCHPAYPVMGYSADFWVEMLDMKFEQTNLPLEAYDDLKLYLTRAAETWKRTTPKYVPR